jgi:glycerophosphoryl diester phosphodiesterase
LFNAPIPDLSWDQFNSPSAKPLNNLTKSKIEGAYAITAGADVFGGMAAAKWSYTVSGVDTTYHLSFFCEKQTSYIICEGKRVDSTILLNGYWRKMVNTDIGKVRLMITPSSGARYLLNGGSVVSNPSITIDGYYGYRDNGADIPLTLVYQKPLFNGTDFNIVAHRGGGRTADLLPASENTVEMIRLASRFGATGIEIDVQMTKDNVPVLFHDATLNERLIQKNGMVGPVSDYTYAQLNELVRLTGGEKIPTLREALNTVVYETPLRFVWLDTKYSGPMDQERQIQHEYLDKAAAIGRQLKLVIGLPDDDAIKNFMQLPNYQAVPSLVEVSPEKVLKADADYWGPQWTQGLMEDKVAEMHAAGKKVYVWTLDDPENIKKYMYEGHFDAILSNYPSSVAYYYYVRQ